MKVYGVRIDDVNVNAADIQQMSAEEKKNFVNAHADPEQYEFYTLDAFLYYLNADMLDTENYYWVAV